MTDSFSSSDIATSGVINTTSSFPSSSEHNRSNESALYKLKKGTKTATSTIKYGCNSYWSKTCSVDTIKRKLPITKWLPNYRLNHLKSDLIAGLTVGLTVIPQGMAYATLAGLDLEYGLYSSFMGCFIYCLMGTSKDITMGPTAIMSILVSEYAVDPWGHHDKEETNPTLAVMLAFLCGIIQILMAVFRLGFLVRFISHPVITGFTCASAIIIAGTQFNKIFGISTPRGFFITIYTICRDINQTKVWDLTMGLSCMIILYLLKFAKEKWSSVKDDDTTTKKILRNTLWFVATARNAIIVILCALIAFAIGEIDLPPDERSLTLTKNVSGGIPPFQLPSFTYNVPGTNQTYYFGDMLNSLNVGLAMVPLIGFLEAIAIAKSFGRKNKYKIDSEQELLTIGISNFFSSFVSSYPITGSFGRSAVNAQCNVMTPLGGVVTGSIVLLALEFLTEAFQYIPSAALGAVIIMAVINLFSLSAIIDVARVSIVDLIPLLVTFICCFWDVAYGIMIGIGVSLIFILLEHSIPRAKTYQDGDMVILTVKKGLDFPGAECIENKLQKLADIDGCKLVVMDCTSVTNMDYSAVEAFYHGTEALKNSNVLLKLCGLTNRQEKMLKKSGILKFSVTFYDTLEEAINGGIHDSESNHHKDEKILVEDGIGLNDVKTFEEETNFSIAFHSQCEKF